MPKYKTAKQIEILDYLPAIPAKWTPERKPDPLAAAMAQLKPGQSVRVKHRNKELLANQIRRSLEASAFPSTKPPVGFRWRKQLTRTGAGEYTLIVWLEKKPNRVPTISTIGTITESPQSATIVEPQSAEPQSATIAEPQSAEKETNDVNNFT